MLQGLKDMRVLDCCDNIAGSYATKLLADAGAEVIKVEPRGGDPMRRWPGEGVTGDSPLFHFLNTSKQSIVGTPADTAVRHPPKIRAVALVHQEGALTLVALVGAALEIGRAHV